MDLEFETYAQTASALPLGSAQQDAYLQAIVEESVREHADPKKESASDSDGGSEQPVKRRKKTYACDDCGTTYTEKRTLARHRHTDLHRQRIGLPPIKKHACSVCGKLFTRGHDRQRHENEKHRGVRRFTSLEPNSSEFNVDRPAEDTSEALSGQESRTSSPVGPAPSSSIDDERSSTQTAPTPPLRSARNSDLKTSSSPEEHPWWMEAATAMMEDPDGLEVTGLTLGSTMRESPSALSDHGVQVVETRPTTRSAKSATSSREDSAVEMGATNCNSESKARSNGNIRSIPPFSPTEDTNQSLRSPPARLNSSSMTKSEAKKMRPTICIVCSMPFEEDLAELIPHLRGHLEHFQGKHRCSDCQVNFVHKQDLLRHLKSASQGHCGFNFEHNVPCGGHHPPVAHSDNVSFSDGDSFRLCNQLRHWEQSQLRAYMDEVKDLVSARQVKQRDFDCYSIEALLRPSRDSFQSLAISINTNASAPCDVTADGKYDVGGLQKRLRLMSLGTSKSATRHLVSKRSGVTPNESPDKPLSTAILDGDLEQIEQLLDTGTTQPFSITSGNAELTTAALWGQAYATKIFAAHKVQIELWGHCPACRVESHTLTNDAYLVKSLLKHKADPNRAGGLCGSPLATAAWLGRTDLIPMLFHYGARVDTKGTGKFASPLCAAAAQTGHTKTWQTMRLLIEKGADVRARGTEGSVLEIAEKRRNHWAMKALGSQIPFDVASQLIKSCDKTIRLLEDAGVDEQSGEQSR